MKQQKLLFGDGSCREIEKILAENHSRRAFLVCDGAFDHLEIRDYFDSLRIPLVHFDAFTPNPLYTDVVKGAQLYQKTGCDIILAVGGGSAIDVAKCIRLFQGMDPQRHYLHQDPPANQIKLLAVPTTAGTGSESTRFAVIYDQGEKQSVSGEHLIPDYVILEPRALKTLPLYQRTSAMLDALCQAIESWWSVNSNEESREYSRQALGLVIRNMEEYLQNTDEGNRQMLLGANYAGRAINITQTTAAHAMSYKVTSLTGIPHGHAVALCLPKVWRYMLGHLEQCSDCRGSEYLAGIFHEIARTLGQSSPEEAVNWLEGQLEQLNMTAPTLANRQEALKILAGSVNPVRLKNNPVSIKEQDFLDLYGNVFPDQS